MVLGVIVAGTFAANAGALEVVGVPGGTHLGVYPYLGGSLILPGERVTLVTGLAVEWSPESDRWGLVATFTADVALSPRLGLDLNLAVIHDKAGGDLGGAAFFAGAGPGLSIFAGRWTVSPFVSLFHGLNVSGWSLVPGVNVAVGL